jgi:DNA-binding LacI/PurR family transcriptional regulator
VVTRPRLKDVAERAGVSMKTVSNVVHDFPHVRPATREKVLAAIAELDYRPNLSARNLALGRAGTIALVVPELDMPYFAALARHVLEAADRAGWFVLIVQTHGEAAAELAVLRGRLPQRIDGVILNPLHATADQIADRTDAVPLVLIGEATHDGAADHVAIDNVAAARLATAHLLGLGRRRVAMIGASLEPAVSPRRDGYLAALDDHGIAVDHRLVVPTSSNRGEDGETATAALLDATADDPPDAVFCATDWLALGAVHALRARGLVVPDDVAVVGFDDIPYSRVSSPTLTTIAPARDEIARAVVASLQRQQGGGSVPREIVAGFELVVRESSGGAASR